MGSVWKVFQVTPDDIQFFYPEGYGYFGYEQKPLQKNLQDYGYNPRLVRLAELIYLHAYMLEIYNNKISKELEELKDVEEDQYPDKIKDIADLKKGIIISLEEFYLIEDSLGHGVDIVFIRYGKQRLGLDIVHENLRDKMDDLSEISSDMYDVHAQESMRDLTKGMRTLTVLVLILTFFLAGLGVYEQIRRFREKRAKK
jgi:cell division protein FtsX